MPTDYLLFSCSVTTANTSALPGCGFISIQALPDMLEVLPPGASKGHGVEVLLKHLGIDPLHLMALGEQATAVVAFRV